MRLKLVSAAAKARLEEPSVIFLCKRIRHSGDGRIPKISASTFLAFVDGFVGGAPRKPIQ
jgi:hypothetical protein